ncbi:hypothetical protein Cs7R123_54980 [Catellatospora sp. TT07R-123]|uniref:hypothetical protein n=1 Tax=Catellatospora sp. TT07R-123 TaxID=2733863 RepID=UPI001B299182|nr:hypothetical protein [Catellatospora sp. TT07R-123]GHJ48156.1 hypothetical protein Cs7R123_54980 [Catellatospora sp. TT07R-123]
MNDEPIGATEPSERRVKSYSLPTDLAEYVERKAGRRGASAYISSLIAADRHRDLVRRELEDFGYTGELAITAEGRAKARRRLDRHAASRAARSVGEAA